MNLDEFLLNVKYELVEMETFREIFLVDRLSVKTSLSFFSYDKKPGFFSPWLEMARGEYIMSPTEAGKELIIKACANLLLICGNVIQLFTIPFLNNEELNASTTERWCASFVGALYYSVNFLVDLILNLTAIITRSLASIVLGVDLALANIKEQFAPN